ncbi:MAG: hypothetical protein KAJ86_00365 [Alphaproteobacteria bacterium]|nr:hypothetical protein [Alphaproteobacteria bacterium]
MLSEKLRQIFAKLESEKLESKESDIATPDGAKNEELEFKIENLNSLVLIKYNGIISYQDGTFSCLFFVELEDNSKGMIELSIGDTEELAITLKELSIAFPEKKNLLFNFTETTKGFLEIITAYDNPMRSSKQTHFFPPIIH